MKRIRSLFLVLLLALSIVLNGCSELTNTTPQNTTAKNDKENSKETPEKEKTDEKEEAETPAPEPTQITTPAPIISPIDLNSIPAYSDKSFVSINGNVPFFNSNEMSYSISNETYSNLDGSGRCGVAFAVVGTDLMPTGERGNIGSVKPTGWQTIKYDNVGGKYLYNRCHLIGFQLSGENANVKNLITGTRYLNIEGMLPFENMVADYVKETKKHVLYRITPIFEGNNLLASGVLMEGYSVEDYGKGIQFCVYAYNVQPGITIAYANGDSVLSTTAAVVPAPAPTPTPTPAPPAPTPAPTTPVNPVSETYVLNTSTKKFHKPGCGSVKTIKDSNKGSFTGSRDELIKQGYSPCGNCNP